MNNTDLVEILYIEDDEGLWALVEHKLSKRRIKLVGAATIASANTLLQEKQYALVLIDHELPDGTGYELLKTIYDKFPCIMLTGVGSEELAVQCLKSGVRDYLVKDVKGNYLDT